MLGLLFTTGGALLAKEEANANERVKRIVILGDSITAGYGLEPQQAYPALLQERIQSAKIPYSVANAGVSGDTTAGGLRRVSWALAKGADVLLIALGGNDGLRGISPVETKANLAGIVKKAREKNPDIRVIIAGMQMPENMGKEFTTRFNALFSEVAKEQNTSLVPFLLDGVGGVGELNQDDRIHPNEAGQKIVADNVWEILRGELAPRTIESP